MQSCRRRESQPRQDILCTIKEAQDDDNSARLSRECQMLSSLLPTECRPGLSARHCRHALRGCFILRKVKLIRSPAARFRRGTECCQWCWIGPDMTSSDPCARQSLNLRSRSRLRKQKSRFAPKEHDAISGRGPYTSSSSACQPIESSPVR